MKRPFAVIGFTVFLTIAFLFDKETGVTAAAFAAFTVALVVALFSKRSREAKVLPLSMASGAVACAVLLATNYFYLLPLTSYSGGVYHMKARITSEVEIEYGNYYYKAEALTIGGNKTDADIRLVFDIQPDVEPYDFIEGDFTFYQPGISKEIYLNANRASGLVLGAYPVNDGVIITDVPESEKPLGMKLINLRNEIKNAVFRAYPDERGALAVAMLLGDKSAVPSDIYENLRLSGLSHIICVSGLHLTLWASMILAFLRKIGLREKLACAIAATGVIGFMFLTGFSYSVMRSGIMMLVYLLSCFVSRKSDSLNSLGFSLLIISLISPYAMAAVGLQLSALATLGIVLYNEHISPVIREAFDKRKQKKFFKLVYKFADALGVTLSAILLIQPVLLKMTGGFSFASIISNIFITPFAGGAMTMSAFGAAANAISPSLNYISVIGRIFLEFIIKAAGLVAKNRFLAVSVDGGESSLLIGLMLFYFAFAVFLACKFKPKPLIASALACVIFFSGIIIPAYLDRNETRIRIVDTGNGVSVLFVSGKETVLVGCGGTDFSAASEIADAINDSCGRLDCLILPSADGFSAEHSAEITEHFRPARIYCNDLPENTKLLSGRSEICSFSQEHKTENFTVKFYQLNGKCHVYVKTKNISSLVCAFPGETLSSLPEEFRNADMVVSRNDYPPDITDYGVDFTVICAENRRGLIIQNELISKGTACTSTGGCGDLSITAENGNLSIRRE